MRLSGLAVPQFFWCRLQFFFGRAEVRGVGCSGSQNVCIDLGIGAGEFLEIGLDGYFDHTGLMTTVTATGTGAETSTGIGAGLFEAEPPGSVPPPLQALDEKTAPSSRAGLAIGKSLRNTMHVP